MRRCAGVLAVVVLGGCSGGSSEVSKTDFVKQVEAICRRENARIAKFAPPDRAKPDSVATAAAKIVAAQQNTLKELTAVAPPTADAATIEHWLALVAQTLDASTAIVTATKNGDQAAIDEASREASSLNRRADDAASAYGLKACVSAR